MEVSSNSTDDTSKSIPTVNGRKLDGTFAPGTVGNPNGRPIGALNKSTLIKGELTEDVIKQLWAMPKAELFDVIKRIGGAIWSYALKNDEERTEAARFKLYIMGMSADEPHRAIAALDKWFDRTHGKAAVSIYQQVDQRIEHKVHPGKMEELTTEKLLALVARAGDMKLLPGGVTVEGEKVVVDAEYVDAYEFLS